MSQVLQFGIPHGFRLRCDNPVCDELADNIAKVSRGDETHEVFGCKTHFNQLVADQNVTRVIVLNKPGERNSV